MNKKQELKKQTWIYFWQQKTLEIVAFLLIVALIVFIPFTLGHFIGDNVHELCGDNAQVGEPCGIVDQWLEGVIYIIVTVMILLLCGMLIFALFRFLFEWVENNWNKASNRAEAKLKEKKK